MKIEQWKLSDITPYHQNPRINDKAVDAVARSLQEFGFRQPIVVDEDDVIIVGHTQYKAAQMLSLDTVPVHVAEGLTPAQIKAYRIADNQTDRGLGPRPAADRVGRTAGHGLRPRPPRVPRGGPVRVLRPRRTATSSSRGGRSSPARRRSASRRRRPRRQPKPRERFPARAAEREWSQYFGRLSGAT